MKRNRYKVLFCLSAILAFAETSWAVTNTSTLTVNSTIAARASLSIGSTINFPDADPTASPSVPATENAVAVTARVRTGNASTGTLTALAGGDLVSGANTIPVSAITWTATGTGFVAGTMNKTTAQSVGSWTGSGIQAGTLSYFFANSWAYPTGSYTVSVTYTLTAP